MEAQQEDEEMLNDPFPIERLEEFGIVAVYIKKLRDGGLCTVEAVAYSSRKVLLLIQGISETDIDRLIEAASKLVPLGGFTSGSQLLAQRFEKNISGSRELDKILDGGIAAGSITEIYGESCAGKTQLCHTLCVTCQLPLDQGGGDGKAMYIDTDGTFRQQRILDIAKRFGLDGADVLKKVFYAKTMILIINQNSYWKQLLGWRRQVALRR